MKINVQKLTDLYLERVNRIADDLEDKSVFSPQEVVAIVCEVLEENWDSLTRQYSFKGFEIPVNVSEDCCLGHCRDGGNKSVDSLRATTLQVALIIKLKLSTSSN